MSNVYIRTTNYINTVVNTESIMYTIHYGRTSIGKKAKNGEHKIRKVLLRTNQPLIYKCTIYLWYANLELSETRLNYVSTQCSPTTMCTVNVTYRRQELLIQGLNKCSQARRCDTF